MSNVKKVIRGHIVLHKPTFGSNEVTAISRCPWIVKVDIWGEPWHWHVAHKPTKRNVRKFVKLSMRDYIEFHGDPVEWCADDENYAFEG